MAKRKRHPDDLTDQEWAMGIIYTLEGKPLRYLEHLDCQCGECDPDIDEEDHGGEA